MINKTPSSAYILLILFGVLLFNACSSTRPATEKGPSSPSTDAEDRMDAEERELQLLLDRTRNVLAENTGEGQLDIPKAFRKETPGADSEVNLNPYQGYRVQLISTRDVQKADEISAEFEEWIRDTFPEYPAQSYVFFKQPYYKVHVGDFQDRKKAIGFTQVLKKKYPGAWVVPDRINPSSVAADSVNFITDTTDTRDTKSIFN